MSSLLEMLARRAALHPLRTALIVQDQRVTYAQLVQHVHAAATELHRCGVKHGDVVLLAAPSSLAFIYAYFATHLLGGIAAPIDPHAPAQRREEIVRRASPRAAFLAAGQEGAMPGARCVEELASLPDSE